MKRATPFDTIAAVSTPPGEGGIGIVRLSGDMAFDIVQRVFTAHRNAPVEEVKSFSMRLGCIKDAGKMIDEVLVSYMKSPHTYTREDVVEINCHGGAIAVNEVLRLVLRMGARLAEPGEFTKRAFINGRIDLAQAEAVLDIVRSRTIKALDAALNQLNGELSRRIESLMGDMKSLLMKLEANIDFAEEEDIVSLKAQEIRAQLDSVRQRLEELIRTYDTGKIIKEGVLTVLVGKPNVGKSSILNSFVKYDRAIVTPIPGTTRDVIEEELNINGIPFILADTAGIVDSEDVIEREGVKRSLSFMERAQLVLLVLDGSSRFDEKDLALIEKIKLHTYIPIVNKTDLPLELDIRRLVAETGMVEELLYLSARTGEGLQQLENRLFELVGGGKSSGDHSIMVTSARHFSLLRKALEELDHALETLEEGGEQELIAYDVRSVMDLLGEITGEVSPANILDEIFNNFCIGK